jgi:hypothetical protein
MKTIRASAEKRFVVGFAFGAMLSVAFVAYVLCQGVAWSGPSDFPAWFNAIPNNLASVLISPGLYVTGLANANYGINVVLSVLMGCVVNGVAYGLLFVALLAPVSHMRALPR